MYLHKCNAYKHCRASYGREKNYGNKLHFLQNDLHFWSHTRTHTHLWFATAHLEALKKERVPYTQHRRDGKALGKPGDEPLGANGHQLNVQPIQLLKGFVGRMAMARSWICCMVSSHECDMGTSFKTHPGVA